VLLCCSLSLKTSNSYTGRISDPGSRAPVDSREAAARWNLNHWESRRPSEICVLHHRRKERLIAISHKRVTYFSASPEPSQYQLRSIPCLRRTPYATIIAPLPNPSHQIFKEEGEKRVAGATPEKKRVYRAKWKQNMRGLLCNKLLSPRNHEHASVDMCI
jgi:hypothetical protein